MVSLEFEMKGPVGHGSIGRIDAAAGAGDA
jgi:hypothetical protein